MNFPSGAKIITFQSEKEWLEYRSTRIGSSVMPALFGASKWDSPYSVWARMSGLMPANQEESEAMFWGKQLQSAIAKGYERLTERLACGLGPWAVVQHPQYAWLYCTPDFISFGSRDYEDNRILEIKNYDPTGSAYCYFQAQQQMLVTGLSRCDLYGLKNGNTGVLVEVTVDDPDLQNVMIDLGEDMMRRVRENDPPAVDGSDATKEAQKARWPEHREGATVTLDGSVLPLLKHRETLKAYVKQSEAEISHIEAQLIEMMGAAQYAEIPGYGRITSVPPAEIPEKVSKAYTRKRYWIFPRSPKEVEA